MGIDILPAEFPVESSDFFSKALYPFIKEMVKNTTCVISSVTHGLCRLMLNLIHHLINYHLFYVTLPLQMVEV